MSECDPHSNLGATRSGMGGQMRKRKVLPTHISQLIFSYFKDENLCFKVE